MRLMLITDDREYAKAFAGATAATQRDVSVSVAGHEEYRAGRCAGRGCVLLIDASEGSASSGSLPIGASEGSPSGGSLPIDICHGAGQGCVLLTDECRCAEYGGLPTAGAEAEHGGKPFAAVDKYAGVGRICGEARIAGSVSRGAGGMAHARPLASCSAEVISVLGLEGGAGASSIALGLAGELSAYRAKNILYLSMEAFESPYLGVSAAMSGGSEVSAFMFHFLRAGEGRESIPSALHFISRDDYGVSRFVPTVGLGRLRELSGEALGRFVRELSCDLGADFVFIDWGSCIGEDTAEWMADSSAALFVMRHGGVKSRIAGAEGTSGNEGTDGSGWGGSGAGGVGSAGTGGTGSAGAEGIAGWLGVDADRACFVVNRQPPEPDMQMPKRCIGICDDPYAFEHDGERISISLATAFGTGIKELADKVLAGGDGDADIDSAAEIAEDEDTGGYDAIFAA